MGHVFLSDLILLVGYALVLLGTVSSLLAARFGAPILLVFLLVGVLAGEAGPGQIHFADYWAPIWWARRRFQSFCSMAACGCGPPPCAARWRRPCCFRPWGVIFTAGLVALAAVPLLGLGPLESLLVGSIVASTDAAAVLFLVRAQGLRLGRRMGAVIEIESATNDPAAVFLTVTLVELIASGAGSPGWALSAAWCSRWRWAVRWGWPAASASPSCSTGSICPAASIRPWWWPSAVLIYAATALVHGSGFLAVYLAGLVLGNRPVRAIAAITASTTR